MSVTLHDFIQHRITSTNPHDIFHENLLVAAELFNA